MLEGNSFDQMVYYWSIDGASLAPLLLVHATAATAHEDAKRPGGKRYVTSPVC